MARENVYLASKPRYEILDGLRGVAAVMVVIFHLFETYSKGPAYQIVNHGYLAVDFFFVLSGFVIGYAYDDRWDRMTTWGFFKRRLTRLHPMVIVGTLVGFCLLYFGTGAFPGIGKEPLWKILLVTLFGFLMIPTGRRLDIRGWNEDFALNGPQWTLLLEYCANILYALVFRHLPKVVLAVLCVVCAFFTLDLTMGWDVFGLFTEHGPHYNVIGGWSLDPEQLYIGFTRLLYPFLAGLLISRILPGRRTDSNPSGSPIRIRGGFWWCALAIVIILAMPCIGGKSGVSDGLFKAASILVLFPLIVLTGAGSRTTDAFSARFCKFLGEISYPLYITHYPLIYMQMGWAYTHGDAPLWQHVLVGVGVLVFAVAMAYALVKAYDQPVRQWLTEHWLKKNGRG